MNRKYLLGLMVLSLSIAVFTTCKKNKDIDIDSFKIENQKVDSITANSVYISGFYTYTGGTVMGIKVNIWNEGNVFDSTYEMELDETNFSKHIRDLKTSTEYCYRYIVVFGTNDEHEIDSIFCFKTLPISEQSYTITACAVPSEGGTINGKSIFTQDYFAGDTCTLMAEPADGYTFTNWTENGEEVPDAGATYTFTVEDGRELVANFIQEQPTQFTVKASVAPSDGGTINGSSTFSQTYLSGETCTLTAEPAAGFAFSNWIENGEEVPDAGATCSFTVEDDHELVANFIQEQPTQFTVTASAVPSDGGTINGSSTFSQTYLFGETCTLTANPADGFAFSNWTENGGEVLYAGVTYSFTVENDHELVANFIQEQPTRFTVTASVAPSDGGTVNGSSTFSQTYLSGETCTLTAESAAGFAFSNWTENGGEVPDAGTTYSFTVEDDHELVANFIQEQPTRFTVTASVAPSDGGTINGSSSFSQTYLSGETCTLTAESAAGFAFSNWTENGEEVPNAGATYSFTVEDDHILEANFDHAYVDLGLPSGLLWATCNVGADNPEDYGDYFAWGEIDPKDTYTNANYNYSDNPETLPPEHDAATAQWGSGWRMPTKEEWEELKEKIDHVWTTQNGVNGWLFTASNGNSLFLPAAGWRDESNRYWSSSLETDHPSYAYALKFDSVDIEVYYYNRFRGFTVRPVRSSRQK